MFLNYKFGYLGIPSLCIFKSVCEKLYLADIMKDKFGIKHERCARNDVNTFSFEQFLTNFCLKRMTFSVNLITLFETNNFIKML